jgi:hypothetical protein
MHGGCVTQFLQKVSRMANKAQKTVLIVENQPNYTQLLVKQLLFADVRPVVAITGEGGIKRCPKDRRTVRKIRFTSPQDRFSLLRLGEMD